MLTHAPHQAKRPPSPTTVRGQPPDLGEVLAAAQKLPNLVCLDLGPSRSLVTWGDGPTVKPGPRWISQARSLLRANADGGLVGWLGYESGRWHECMDPPASERPLPDLYLRRVEGRLVRDRDTDKWHIHGTRRFRREAELLLQSAKTATSVEHPGVPVAVPPQEGVRYRTSVDRALASIARGDVYQVCLAWEVRDIPVANPLSTWLELRRANPAWRGAYLQHGQQAIICNSPETYLDVERTPQGLKVRSVPIKGTARLSEGEAGRRALLHSPKEIAELTMIVDLVRNDFGRVAAPGTIRWQPRRLRPCGDLLHAEQEVTAKLRPGCDAFDAVAASFPPGSVTGAPKVAAMRLIHRLESGPRGIYTGAIGWFGDDGSARLNVAIRTATVINGRARFHVGAGIVADSNPEAEWRETLAKGSALARALAPATSA